MPKDNWPQAVGSGWNTSDGYRFRREETARAHQERTSSKPARFGRPSNVKARAKTADASSSNGGDA